MLYEIIVSGHVETYKNGYNFSACLRPHEQKSALVMLVTDFGDRCGWQIKTDSFENNCGYLVIKNPFR